MTKEKDTEVTIYCDGACSGNPGPGGWGAILHSGGNKKELAGGEPHTTNNRMELGAALAALRQLKGPCRVTVVSDSQYLVQGMSEWITGWQKKGWKTTKGAVLNRDLWEQLLEQANLHRITWQWVRGHNGHPENERCDELARGFIAHGQRTGNWESHVAATESQRQPPTPKDTPIEQIRHLLGTIEGCQDHGHINCAVDRIRGLLDQLAAPAGK